MHLISIQGPECRRYYLDHAKERVMTALLRTLFENQFLYINSPYKIDLAYESKHDHHRYLIKEICKLTGAPCSELTYRQFYHTDTLRNVLEVYFIRLYRMYQRKDWYNMYMTKFDEEIRRNPANPLIKHILSCFQHIELSPIKTSQYEDMPAPQLTINRYKTYWQLMDYLDNLILN